MNIKFSPDKNIKIAVIGLGKSGVACANLAVNKGYGVFASDSDKAKTHAAMKLNKKVDVEFGKHSGKILESDIIIKSPGIHADLNIFKEAEKRNIPVISELDFALNFIKPKKIIAITGTNGKTTTTALTGKIIKDSYKNTVVAGNIGSPLSSLVNKINNKTVLVLELSSYQLEDSPYFRPDISVLLNITPDHIEHHKTMADYIKAKERIFKKQTFKDTLIFNYKDKILKKITAKTNAKKFAFNLQDGKSRNIFYKDKIIYIRDKKKKFSISPSINIPGAHNIDNILAAVAACYSIGIKLKTIEKIISGFKGIEHRIEFVKNINGVSYYNDSKGTNVDSTKVALESFDKNIHLILGGLDKGCSYKSIYKLIKSKVKDIMLIGSAAPIIEKQLKNSAKMYKCNTLKNAVEQIKKIAVKGDIVLFSPACASFDQFENFEHRGREFKKFISSAR